MSLLALMVQQTIAEKEPSRDEVEKAKRDRENAAARERMRLRKESMTPEEIEAHKAKRRKEWHDGGKYRYSRKPKDKDFTK